MQLQNPVTFASDQVQKLKDEIEHAVKIAVLKEDVVLVLSRLTVLDPDNDSWMKALIAIEGLK